jgi:hypothetical protein
VKVSEVKGFIGRIGYIYLSGLRINVKIIDIKERWGRTRYLVKPVDGDGEIWVENIRISEDNK